MIAMPECPPRLLRDKEQWAKGWNWAASEIGRADPRERRAVAARLVRKAKERQDLAQWGRGHWSKRRDFAFWSAVFAAGEATVDALMEEETQQIEEHLAKAHPHSSRHPGVVGQIEVYVDGSGAPAVLTYKGIRFAFNYLNRVTAHRLGTPTKSEGAFARKVAESVLGRAYEELLAEHTTPEWRRLNAEMYADVRGNPPRERAIPPMPDRWWQKKPPAEDAVCYRTKTDALNKFLTFNWRLVEEWGGPSRDDLPSEFDAINAKYGLKGSRRVTTLAQAAWWALPGPAPWCMTNIDVDLLNRTSPGIHAQREIGVGFEVPDYAQELELAKGEEIWFRAQGEEPRKWKCIYPTGVEVPTPDVPF